MGAKLGVWKIGTIIVKPTLNIRKTKEANEEKRICIFFFEEIKKGTTNVPFAVRTGRGTLKLNMLNIIILQ